MTRKIVTEDNRRCTALKLSDICEKLSATVLCGEDRLDLEIQHGSGCDLMSDVLAFTKPEAVLLTGLTNNQVVKTAGILDLKAIVFVRNKKPDKKTIEMAEEIGIPLLSSPLPLFESCGLLYSMGLRGEYSHREGHDEE